MLQVCVDANILVKLVLFEEYSDLASTLWQAWEEQEVERIAPPFMPFEAVSAIRSNLTRKLISAQEADIAFHNLQSHLQAVRLQSPPDLLERAWETAKGLRQGQVFDAYYVALAQLLDCELWTVDEKLYVASFRVYSKVKHIRSAR